MEQKLERLLSVAGEADAEDLRIARNARVACREAYEKEHTAIRDKDLKSAENRLAETIDRLWPRYFPEDERFKNLLEAMKYLKGQGYKIAKSKIYKDSGDKQIRVQADGSIYKKDADAYAKTLKLLGDPLKGLEAAQKRKADLEIQRLEQIVAAQEHEQKVRENKYVLKADAELDRANNAGAIFVALSNGILSAARELIDACAGDQHRVEAFIEAVKQELERVANSLSKMEEFEVIFTAEAQ